MGLAYVNNYFPYLTETFIQREIIELQRQGIEIKVYSIRCPEMSNRSRETDHLRETAHYLLPVKTSYLVSRNLKYFFKNPYTYVATFLKMIFGTHLRTKDRIRSLLHFGEGVLLADKIMEDRITHLHAHYASQSTSITRVAHLLTKIPYSFTAHAHDIWHDQLLIPEKLEEATFVITCSRFGKEWLLRHARTDVSDKVHVVYHGLDVRKFIPPADEKCRVENLILSIGSLGETKGYPDLIEACSILRDRGFPFTCMIVGEGEERKLLEGLIRKKRLEVLVKLVGKVLPENIIDYLYRSYVFVLPCVTAKDGRQDGIPNVLMEAMATGLPVITTRNTAQTELIEDGIHGLLVYPHRPQEIADSIQKICNDDLLRKSIQAGARKRMEEEFDCSSTIEPLIQMFKDYAKV